LLAGIGLALGAMAAARGDDVESSFTAVSGSWNVGSNWSPTVVPNNGADTYEVTMPDGSQITEMDSNIEVSSFTLLGNLTFQNNISGQTLTVDGDVTQTTGTWLVSGAMAMVLDGNTTIGAQVTLQNGAGFMNNGNLTVNSAGTDAYTSGGTPAPLFSGTYNVVNNGVATWNNQSSVQFANFVVANAGTMTLNLSSGNSFVAGTYDQTQSTGLTMVGPGATLQANQMNLTAGQVFGTGTYSGSNFVLGNGSNAGATVTPGSGGNTTGTLTFLGNFNTIGGATFGFDLGGTGQGTTYDELVIGNNVNFNNTSLVFYLVNGYVPSNSDVFTIITSTGTVSGMFNNISGGVLTKSGVGTFNVNVGSGAVTLSNFSPVPEPRLDSLLGGLAILTGVFLRRRRHA
jgi:hypothetical protein